MINDYIKLLESLKQYQVSKVIEQVERKVFELIKSEHASSLITQYFSKINADGVPFSQYELDPANISQIKKLANALYYARLAFKGIEKLDLKNIQFNFSTNITHNLSHLPVLKKIFDNASKASCLATHLDVDLQDMFASELAIILPLFNQLKSFAESQTVKTTKLFKTQPVIYKAGEVVGTAIDQMRPLGGDVDYNFLTQFSAVLPSYIHQFTQYIQQYSTQIKETEPKLNKAKLDEIQNAALNLLNDIENLQGNSLFISMKFLNYIYIIRSIITLSMSSLEQIGEFSDGSQDLVREKIAQLKYDILPVLFGLVDKIEVNSMLKPGTLSIPLMEKVQKLYQALLYIPSKAIDFNTKGAELLSIEDSRFIDLRLKLAYQRINAANTAKDKAHKAQSALTRFYAILHKPEHNNLCIHQLSSEIKEQLITHYKIFKPYLEQLDIDLHVCLVHNLLSPEVQPTYFQKTYHWLTGHYPLDYIKHIINKQHALQGLITKSINSQTFHIKLNKALIRSVHKTAQLALFPYNETTSIYHIDESEAFATGQKPPLKLKLKATEQRKIQNNFKKLCQLIQAQIKAGDVVLTTGQLDKATKDQCRVLFNKVQPYFAYIMPAAQKEDVMKLERYLAAVLSNKNIQAKNIPSVALFSKVTEQGQQFLANTLVEWGTKPKAYYDLEQNIFLDEEESTKLRNEERKKLVFIKSESSKVLQSPDQLSSDQARTLSQWHSEKHNKCQKALKVYLAFNHRLNKLNPEHSVLSLMELKDKTKKAFRNIYSIFQPYFVADASEEHKELIIKLDKYFAAILSNRPVSPDDAPLISDFLQLEPYLKSCFSKCISTSHKQMQFYDTIAQQRFITENDTAVLDPDTKAGDRAHYLLKHTAYSEALREFRKAMFHMTARFNKSMQAELIPQATGLPFPEMEKPNQQLTQGKQVGAIKELYNSLYHLEAITLQLEQLNDIKQFIDLKKRAEYLLPLLNSYTHINELVNLSKRLKEDPHYGFIARELMDKAQNVFTKLQEHSAAYQVGHDQVLAAEPVHYNPLWYILNTFYISPQHIKALKNVSHLTIEEENELHAAAKNATWVIEGIIKSSDSYLQLFLQAPRMLSLYKELTNKLNEFTTTIHDTSLNNLDEIRATVITPMLLEADLWESKLGLEPGLLSEPLRKITDEFFKGLIHPLKLHSKTHITLICTPEPLEQRTKAIEEQISKAQQRIAKITPYYADINALYSTIQDYKKSPPLTRLALEQDMRKQYKLVLPKLARLRLDKKIPINANPPPEDPPEDCLFDTICNMELPEYEPHFTGIETLITTSYHYALGLLETHQLSVNINTEQLAYLLELKNTQEEENLLFIEQYTTEAFQTKLDNLCNRHIGLQYTDEEYRTELRKYLQTFAADIINQSKTAEDINLNIQLLLEEKARIFEDNRFAEYYHLDSVCVALSKFKNYFSKATAAIAHKNPLFENEATLSEKTPLINNLGIIAANKELSIKDRINQIKAEVENPNFKRIILKHKSAATLSFIHLKQCFLSLLEALHLYTPTRKKLFTEINEATTNPPEIHALARRFGLFAQGNVPKTQKEPGIDTMPEPFIPAVI
ncbi:MAG: protein SdhA [Legionella sp.]|nr:protein SdhA [Legionella sp.]